MRLASLRCHGFGVIPSIDVTEQLEPSSGRVEFRRRVVAATARQARLPRIAWNRQRDGWIQRGKIQQNDDRNCRKQKDRRFFVWNLIFVSENSADCYANAMSGRRIRTRSLAGESRITFAGYRPAPRLSNREHPPPQTPPSPWHWSRDSSGHSGT